MMKHPWGSLLLLLYCHFPSSVAMVAMREMLYIAEDSQCCMVNDIIGHQHAKPCEIDPCVIQDGIDSTWNIDLRCQTFLLLPY